MFFKKRNFLFLAVAMLAVPLVACDPADSGVKLKVWAPTEDKAVMEHIISEFNKTEEGKGVSIELKHVKEGDVRTELTKDAEAAADVFALVDDNLTELVKTNNLLELKGQIKTDAIAASIDWTVDAATRDGKLYGFPQTSDNTYFLWYNKALVDATDIATLEGLLAKAKSLGKNVEYDIPNAWQGTSLYLGGGGTISVTPAAQAGDPDIQNCNYDSAGVVDIVEKAYTLKGGANGSAWTANDNVVAGMTAATPTVVAGVGGTWQYEELLEALGDDLGAAKLPTLDGKQLGSFRSAKLVSVKANTKYPNEALAFAKFSTSYDSQKHRFEQRGIGPANKVASELPAVNASVMLAAVNAQNEFGVNQATAVTGGYWDPVGAIGKMIMDQDWDPYDGAASALAAAVSQMNQ
ncbi:MAG: extracellular solute-binding protein [Bacilli bacterium]|jgi:arabinogalactan oligomer/maltooligosaccharide transport system substrate-binding protein|nr:extracellular solute-binding protein [Erysipelotrichia bacterium]